MLKGGQAVAESTYRACGVLQSVVGTHMRMYTGSKEDKPSQGRAYSVHEMGWYVHKMVR